ncbi:MAG: 3-methyl-2-oxobutanoate hydroxymethyltransferase [Nanoarchaeota archaeon]
MDKIQKIRSMKSKEKIAMLTAYGYSFASILGKADIDIILVGDSLGNVVMGYDTTQKVTIEDMIRHTQAVRNGAPGSLIVTDMPYRSDETKESALKNTKLLLKAGADAVKVEGKPDIVKHLTKNNIKVMAHIGHLPQTDKPKVHKELEQLLKQAKELEEAGAFAIVLEMVQSNIAKQVTDSLEIPTIGIGAGPYCDGQVLVINDMLGLFDKFKPKFVKQYTNLSEQAGKAIKDYIKEVKESKFPDKEHSFD